MMPDNQDRLRAKSCEYSTRLLTLWSFVAWRIQRDPIAVKIAVDMVIADLAHNAQISLSRIAWKNTARFQIY
ncbi:MAG: hypothetical protein CEE38_09835 [Planctomycetes bacterium B3_Pla]|nr:MAG: hypothetical protein CEE38_09835 [Planctomycetes bacterium B3_Pla]